MRIEKKIQTNRQKKQTNIGTAQYDQLVTISSTVNLAG